MSKKHYEFIAKTIRDMNATIEIKAIVANHFADAHEKENARFNREKFLIAALTIKCE